MLNKNSNIMKSKLFFLALSAMALATSCSNDEVTELSDSNAIKYDLGIGKITRATDVYCNANKFTSFKVWANYTATGGTATPYIAGDNITSTDGSTWADASGTRYWPNEGTLDFYALAGYSDPTLATGNTVTWSVTETVANQQDLCYAVKKGQSKANSTVALNFRHALSQIVFKAQNKNAKLYVEIEEVGVCNVNSGAIFTLPTANTDNNKQDHTSSDATFEAGSQGAWASYTGAAKYTTEVFNKVVEGNSTVVNLTDNTSTNSHVTNDYGKAMLLLPVSSTTTPWDGETQLTINAGTYTPAVADGTLILVKCKIWNVAGETVNKGTDVVLYSNDDETKSARWAAIPASFAWEQGKKYIYTLVFDKGNGGIDPDPEDPDPVLVKIDYTVQIDDFVKGENYDIDMDEKGSQTTTPTSGNSEEGGSDEE